MQEQGSAEEAGGVVASLERVDGERRFVVRNIGEIVAHDVRFKVDAEREKNSPVSAGDLKRVFPVAELEPGGAVSVCAIITPGTGLHFRGVVSWRDPDAVEHQRVLYMSA